MKVHTVKYINSSDLRLSEEQMEVINNSDLTFGTNNHSLVDAKSLLGLLSENGYEEEDFPELCAVLDSWDEAANGMLYVDLEN